MSAYYNLVPREGFEPPTLSLEVSCSIHLSYRGLGRDLQNGAGSENRTRVSSLEGWHISHYTTPAYPLLFW